jgi:DNA glycosylase AlkZ-like
MNLKDIARARLINQQMAGTKFKTGKEIVGWMCGMQAQDYNMAKWAVGIRLPGSTEKMIDEAVSSGEIIRTHILRPTWHFVLPEDINWMIGLAAPRFKSSFKSRWKAMGLAESIFKKSNSIIEKALANGKHLTREELVSRLEKAKISTRDQRIVHLLFRAELDGLVCSGSVKDKKQTYALLRERVPKSKIVHREEALANLAGRYFSSHGPATLQDFVWWSGLQVKDSRQALEMIKSKFISEKIGAQTYWFANSFSLSKTNKKSVYLLPAYDEFIISYKERSAAIPIENQKKAISNNGIFRPTILINGQVAGIWRQTIKKEKVIIETQSFHSPDEATKRSVKLAAAKYGDFLNKDIKIKYS